MSELNMNIITCDQAENMMFDYIDEFMTSIDKQIFEAHIDSCNKCKKELNNRINTIKMIRENPVTPEKDLYKSVMENINVPKLKKRHYFPFATTVAAALILVTFLINYDKLMPYYEKSPNDINPSSTKSKSENKQIEQDQPMLFSGVTPNAAAYEYIENYAKDYVDQTKELLVCTQSNFETTVEAILLTEITSIYNYKENNVFEVYVYKYTEATLSVINDIFIDNNIEVSDKYSLDTNDENPVIVLLGIN